MRGARDAGTPWWRRILGRKVRAALDPDRPDLVVVARCFDDVEACSTTLARAEETGWIAADDAVLRHHLVLPADRIADAAALAAQDGYVLHAPDGYVLNAGDGGTERDPRTIVFQRVQVLDALHCSQERSRMAGLAQRHDGDVTGWDALQPRRERSAAPD
ncbi:hypothetical protein DW322_15960 [Rhodococcus rhodnii]|uniref:Uncharacterized protein n=2 Tax=Rhodococcus rhodnii TaxID=38312 RepID=R7WS69_9NOCA|nr:hypothetical protein [Rhodococcus rhodnii]EOM78168.1 hypothetical protein Rrhod_0503 [Rhodococcus rhodnii LMG 5362]TXG91429.1 hypothetical protein DW322_15960 [Rhodococcus rhodnii]